MQNIDFLVYCFLLVPLLGCSPNFSSQGSPNGGSNNLDLNQQDDIFQQSGLPDVLEGMDETYCRDVQPGVAGATSYFTGTYLLDSEGWFGREKWILHPTPAWTATNGETCYITWETTATQADPAGCPNCDFALSVQANINRQQTDCPEGLWEDSEEIWSVSYDILIEGNSAVFYFQESGDFLGEGYSNDNAINFLSDASCTWF